MTSKTIRHAMIAACALAVSAGAFVPGASAQSSGQPVAGFNGSTAMGFAATHARRDRPPVNSYGLSLGRAKQFCHYDYAKTWKAVRCLDRYGF